MNNVLPVHPVNGGLTEYPISHRQMKEPLVFSHVPGSPQISSIRSHSLISDEREI